jgi:hypothetical protein
MMAKQITTTTHNGVEYTLHSTAIDNGKTKVGFAAIPKFDNLEQLATLIEQGWLSESDVVTHVRSAWSIREQSRVRSLFDKKGTFTNEAMWMTMNNLTDEQKAAVGSMSSADGLAYLKQTWRNNQDRVVADPEQVHYPSVPLKAKND